MEILSFLKDYFDKNPDVRFGQVLYNLGIATHLQTNSGGFESTDDFRDIFFTESEEVAKKLASQVTATVDLSILDHKTKQHSFYNFQIPEKAVGNTLPREQELWIAIKAAYQDLIKS